VTTTAQLKAISFNSIIITLSPVFNSTSLDNPVVYISKLLIDWKIKLLKLQNQIWQ